MKVSEIYGGQYMKAEDVDKKGDTYEIISVREAVIGDTSNKPRIILGLDGCDLELSLNKTNAEALAEEYGDDARMWPGRKVHLRRGKTQYKGKTVDCINCLAIPADIPATLTGTPD